MHGCASESVLLVNAEVDSMGGVVDGGVGIGIKTSPRRAAIEKAQAELRQEYDVREERRRELEFLEKGGNPLDFKFGNAASVSVQSTSLTDQHVEHFVTSEAKGSFALTASPHGDSVESSGRPGAPVCEPNSADNFDGENDLLEVGRKPKYSNRRNNISPSEQSFQMDGAHTAKESDDSAIFLPYVRRNRSRPNRDVARSSSTDAVQSSGGHVSSLLVHGGLRNVKGSISEANNWKDRIIPSISNQKSPNSNGDMVSRIETSNTQSNMELDGVQALDATANLPRSSQPQDGLDDLESNILRDNQHDQPSDVDDRKTPIDMDSRECGQVEGKDLVVSSGPLCPPHTGTEKTENETGSGKLNGFSDLKRDGNEGQNGNVVIGSKGLDSESSCTQNSLYLDVNNDSDLFMDRRKNDTNGILVKHASEFDGTQNLAASDLGNEKNETVIIDSGATINDDHNSLYENHSGNGSGVKIGEEMHRTSEMQNEVKCSNFEGVEQTEHAACEAHKGVSNVLNDDSNSNRVNIFPGGPQDSISFSIHELPQSNVSQKNSSADPQSSSKSHLNLVDKAHEDSVLDEAQIIEAKRRRIAELSVGILPSESRRKSHWDFVLEEMTWLANDFAQERVWKLTAAAQICRRVAFTSRLRVEEQNQQWRLKKVAYTLAKAVMQFWHSAEVLLNNNDQSTSLKNCKHDSRKFDENELSENKFGELDKVKCKRSEMQNPGKNHAHAIRGYAIRFLKYCSSPVSSLQADTPETPDRVADMGMMETSWDDHLTEESLFYAVPSGAMETYRIAIESHVANCEKTGSGMQEEVDTSISIYDATAEFVHENVYDEEGDLHGVFEGSKSTKHDQRKRKNFMKSYSARSYELVADSLYAPCGMGSQQSMLMAKRPSSNLNVGLIPTKRMRTASRQRVISPFSAGASGILQAPAKTDASSGDTSSFQDDQTTLIGGSQIQKSVEVNSGEFEKQMTYECAETSTKMKKKKKAKHMVSAYEQRWPLDSTIHNELRDNSKKRPESHHFDSNGTSGLYGLHAAKKPKIMKQALDSTFDNITPMTGSIPSPAASQMSNMSNTNRFIKMIGGRDRGRKAKPLKISAGQPACGNPWSLFEDQALVVLVHDLGPNWELVSDAINSTLQFTCVYRKPTECKEQHKNLMDKGSGDGADSAEDSGSSQSYPSTLPGIPKGSARQLFQRLQGPMEERTLKSHFEKIINIGKKQHNRRSQNDSQDPKQIATVHNSHDIALSQVCPNNLNGGVLTPLDLCDATASSTDVLSLGYQGTHAGSLAVPNQGSVASTLPTSGANSSVAGSSGMVLGNNSPTPSGPLNAAVRDGRYNVPRTSLPVDEPHRMQQYNQMLSSRNLQQSNMSGTGALSGSDHCVRMLPGGNGMCMMPGMNRSMPLSRPGFQGMASSSMLSSGSMLSSSMVGMPSPVNVHPGNGSGQGNSMMRPRDALHMIRPGHPDHQRQMMVPELQMQVTQGTSQGISAFNGLSSAFPNQTIALTSMTYPGHPQQQHHQMPPQQPHVLSNPHHPYLQCPNHATGPQQQAYARQMQQRRLQQQQQKLAASNALMPHVPPQPQLPMSSSMQNSSQIQQQSSSQPASVPPLTPSSPMTTISVQQQQPQQQKHNFPHHGIGRNAQTGASGSPNQMGKHRQLQPQQQQYQQSGRHHPQQRQLLQSPQQPKILKGAGRGNMGVHQNLSIDHSHLNGLTVPQGTQGAEKGEQIMNLMQSQGLYSGTSLSPIQPSKPLVPTQSSGHSQSQQKLFTGSTPPSSKQLQQMPSHSDDATQGRILSVPSGNVLSSTHQAVPAAIMSSNHQNLQPHQQHQKQVNQAQPSVQRMIQHNRQVNSDLPTKSKTDRHGQTEQQPVNNVPQTGTSTTTAMPQVDDLANAVPVVSVSASQWRPSEPLYDSGMTTPGSQVGSIGSPSPTNTSGSEQMSSAGKGLGQRQLSGGLSQHGHNAGAKWQHHQPQLQQPTPLPPPLSQQRLQPQENQLQQEQQSAQQQLPLQQQSQQQAHLQPAQGSLYIRSTNSKLE